MINTVALLLVPTESVGGRRPFFVLYFIFIGPWATGAIPKKPRGRHFFFAPTSGRPPFLPFKVEGGVKKRSLAISRGCSRSKFPIRNSEEPKKEMQGVVNDLFAAARQNRGTGNAEEGVQKKYGTAKKTPLQTN